MEDILSKVQHRFLEKKFVLNFNASSTTDDEYTRRLLRSNWKS